MNHIEILLLAIILDAIFGEPEWLWNRAPHPIAIVGDAIRWLDEKLNVEPIRKAKGIIAIAVLVILAGMLGWVLTALPDFGIIEVIVVSILLAHKSLVQHVMNVGIALAQDLKQGRIEVAKIVGRTTNHMQPSDVSRAAIESAAENFSDGVIAPALWYLFLGLPGIIIYKVVNTADSMIGYKNEQYSDFGFAAAKLDDIMNWVPARVSAVLICLTSKPRNSFDIVLDDAPLHRSPNAGWPEAAMAAALNIALAGPRYYDNQKMDYPYMNAEARHQLNPEDIRRSVSILNIVWTGCAVMLFILVLLF
ncbi:cobalamin biosynthesis protein [Amylibacter sp. SFDW26]|uniref:adenosylcobinamide-phosphate synthase CbiB n=1 Tax=Amylibacter sp. SFDW26 TaxID=2652722 RepID=UPI0012624230|nr:adenosylcobinamide-phosphate synthase CbiB [Amylibacter sp. SFDW26]KAB7614739.1 cobalamin biosynthesis protein [Amylibacter sp. SFDW26]